jgi:RNA polymerase sigma-70 factor, ECF subfamily
VLKDEQEAEDVVQQTYLQAFTKLVDFRGKASLRTWLTRITLNEAIRRRRRQRSTVDVGAIDTTQERVRSHKYLSPLTAPTPESAAARSQIRRILEQAIDSLPATFRLVLILRDVEEVSVEQTAKALGLQPETVRTHRARRMLREQLGEQLTPALKDVFPFERPRCDALVHRLLVQLGLGVNRIATIAAPRRSRPFILP